jgi:hypothetical protein
VKINGDSEADLAKMFDTTPPVSDWHVEMKPFEP